MYNEQERKFLIGLERLTRETGIVIGGCGSPYLGVIEQRFITTEEGYGEGSLGEVAWISPTDFDWENYKHTIVKE